MDFKLAKPTWKQLPVIALGTATAIVTAALAVTLLNQPQTVNVLVAKQNLSEGTVLSQDALTTITLPKRALPELYLQTFKPQLTLNHSVHAGELIPKHALTDQPNQLIPIRLNNLPQTPVAIQVGDRVDVWATLNSSAENTAPEPVCFEAIVTAIETKTDLAQTRSSVELRIKSEYLESTLAVIDSNYKIALILHETYR
ncbi:MAG: hypothetical protein RIS26_1192 [Actinomycetota bacterium]|jgi:Flp pilus assembly protein CpaB